MSSPDAQKSAQENPAPRKHDSPSDPSPGSGDAQSYFAHARVRWLRRCLDELGERPATVLDFGCGHGATTPYFFDELEVRSLVGVDVSREHLAIAQAASTRANATYVQLGDYRATESIDLAYAHGVFAGIPSRERMAAAVLVYRSLKSGGLFALWEDNPWHPARRRPLVSHAASDALPEPLSPPRARQLLRGVGFDIVHTTSAFYFPRSLRWARTVEPLLAPIPLGGQYMVLARKP